jgi:hypothetical protein
LPNLINSAGLQTAPYAELLANLTSAFQIAYGADINLDSDSPDGQILNVFLQSMLDLENLVTEVNANFDPDQAFGVILDQRVALNGIQRQGGTYTVTNITLVTDRPLNLAGLEQSIIPVYTVADNAGNQWQLQNSATIGSAGTYVYSFQGANPGAALTTPNTITTPVTIVLGVTSINNPTTYTTLGENEETCAILKVRRRKSVSLSSQGYLAGQLAALENINGVTSAFVYENVTSATDGDGVPGHSIWCILQGGAAVDIATAIYNKRNAGCGMFGGQAYVVMQADGSPFIINWDYVTPENLFTHFTVTSLDGVNAPAIAQIIVGLVIDFTPGVNTQVNINDLATIVQSIDPNTLVTGAGFSTSSGGTYTPTLNPSAKDKQFAVSSSQIIITPIILTATGSMANVVSSVVIVTLAILPATMVTWIPLGGLGPYTYVLTSSPSGGNVGSSTGIYTSGATAGTDVLQVTDSLSNVSTASITVS